MFSCRSRRPLWPPWPPPTFRRTVPIGRSSSSCAISSSPGSILWNAISACAELDLAEQPVKAGLLAEGPAVLVSEPLGEPEAGVVTRALVFGAGIAQADDGAQRHLLLLFVRLLGFGRGRGARRRLRADGARLAGFAGLAR